MIREGRRPDRRTATRSWTPSRRCSPGIGSTPRPRRGRARTGRATPRRPADGSRCTGSRSARTPSPRRATPSLLDRLGPPVPEGYRRAARPPLAARAAAPGVRGDHRPGPVRARGRADLLGAHRVRPGRVPEVQPRRAHHQLRAQERLVRAARRGRADPRAAPGLRRARRPACWASPATARSRSATRGSTRGSASSSATAYATSPARPCSPPPIADPYARSGAAVARLLGGASPDHLLAWWDAYVRHVAPPVLRAYLEHGVVLEPHLQNVLVSVDDDGMPIRAIFRDLEGTKLLPGPWASFLAGLPEPVARAMTYDAERGWDRVVYCLFVNHLAEVAAAVADLCPPLERELWRLARHHVARCAGRTHRRDRARRAGAPARPARRGAAARQGQPAHPLGPRPRPRGGLRHGAQPARRPGTRSRPERADAARGRTGAGAVRRAARVRL